MAMATATPALDLMETVEALSPLIREHSDRAEREKRLPQPVAEALRDAGLFRMFRPTSREGLGLDPVSEFRVAEALARVDAAAAWNVQVCSAADLYGAWFSEPASREIFGGREAVVAGAFNPRRRAEAVDGGYVVTGRTSFNSNCHGATWMIGLADVFDGDAPRLMADGQPQTLLTAIPAEECEIIDNWDTLGMCGTGSHDVAVERVFVPSARAVPFGPLERASGPYDQPVYRMAMWLTVGCHAAVALGVARAAIDDALALGSRVPAYTQGSLRDRSTVQLRLALAEGRLQGARAYFHAAHARAWEALFDRTELTIEEKARCQMASSTAVLTAREAVDLVHGCVGTAGIREGQRFERHFRDIHVITQHAFVSEARLEAVGQILLGMEPDWGFFAF